MPDAPPAARPAPPAVEIADLEQVVAAARHGEASAIANLYASHGRMVYATAFRCLGSTSDAEDVLQDVFVGLPRALRSYEERGNFAAWLKTVTVRTALMKRRSEGRRREFDLEEAREVAGPALNVADRLAVRAAIAALPADLRIVFMLKEVEGFSHAEIAELLGITSGASAARLFRAWRLLAIHRTAP